jgi:hypothetical protein
MNMAGIKAFAYDIAVENADGVTIYYNYYSDGTELEVAEGAYSGIVNIPEEVTYMNRTRKVTSIGNYAFNECTNLMSVSISNSVRDIRDYAFFKCSSLTSVIIGNSVSYIGGFSFSFCSSLTSISLPNSLIWIGWSAFLGCNNLLTVDIPDNVTTIDGYAFKDCSSLTSVSIPGSVNKIGEYAFCGCSSLDSIFIPYSVTLIGSNAFENCTSLVSVTIPNSVTFFANYLFSGCSSLTSITIPDSISSIGSGAFKDTDLLSVISMVENPFKIEGINSDDRVFSKNTFYNATLYVPKGTIDKYKTCGGWKDFLFVEEGSSANLFTIESEEPKEYKRYTLDGRIIMTPQKSINIIKMNNGTTKKVLVK